MQFMEFGIASLILNLEAKQGLRKKCISNIVNKISVLFGNLLEEFKVQILEELQSQNVLINPDEVFKKN